MTFRFAKIFVGSSGDGVEQEINEWVKANRILIINASISEPEEFNYSVIVVYEQG